MLTIDGSRRSGSGTIVRQAVTFSALTGQSIRPVNARAKGVYETARAKATAKRATRPDKKQRKAKKAATKPKRRRPHIPKASETPAAPPSAADVPWLDPPESGTPI